MDPATWKGIVVKAMMLVKDLLLQLSEWFQQNVLSTAVSLIRGLPQLKRVTWPASNC